MLRRDDFSKEFGLVVQQEIKNFNNLTDNIHKSINNLDKRVTDLQDCFEEENALLDSKINKINLQNQLDLKLIRERQTSHSDCIKINTSEIASVKNDLLNSAHIYEISCSSTDKFFSEYEKRRAEYEVNLKCIKDSVNSLFYEVQDTKNQSRQNAENVKHEILNRPSEAQEVKKEIEQQLQIDRVDFKGAMREIAILKKELQYAIKRIEHLYLQLDRVKSGKS